MTEVVVPLLWNAATAVVILPTADVITQHAEIAYSKEPPPPPEGDDKTPPVMLEPQEFSYRRVGRMAFFAVASTPVWFFWFRFLRKAIPGRDIGSVLLAVCVDKFIFTPPLFAAGLSLNAWIAGENVWEVLKEDFIPITVVTITFWFPIKVAIFYFVDGPYWLVAMRLCDLVYMPLLSHLLNRNIRDEIEDKPTTTEASEDLKDSTAPPPEPKKRKKKITFASPRCCKACSIQ